LRKGFTLIELLIVVAIIAILAAIAVPNFLEAQTRAKVARVKNDLRTIATGVESYRVDNNKYPDGTDNGARYDSRINDFLQPLGLQNGYYGFTTSNGIGGFVGTTFSGVTTPVAYLTDIPNDVFSGPASTFFDYCYRPAKTTGSGYIITSVGPDSDLLAPGGKGTTNPNNLGTFSDTKVPSRLGDVNEGAFITIIDSATLSAPVTQADKDNYRARMEDLTYDATNGTVSDGDIMRYHPQ